jgi:hypothetical protein
MNRPASKADARVARRACAALDADQSRRVGSIDTGPARSPGEQADFPGHSLCASLAIAAGKADANLPGLMRQTRHLSTAMGLGDLRPTKPWTHNVSWMFAAAGGPKGA